MPNTIGKRKENVGAGGSQVRRQLAAGGDNGVVEDIDLDNKQGQIRIVSRV